MSVNKKKELLRTLDTIAETADRYVCIGGVGVCAYRHRNLSDIDIVIPKSDQTDYNSVLSDHQFSTCRERNFDGVHKIEFTEFEKSIQVENIQVGILKGGLPSPPTHAEWPYSYIKSNSTERTIYQDSPNETASVFVPKPEFTIASKLHSGHEIDAYDVTALAQEVDLGHVDTHLARGNYNKLKEKIENIYDMIISEEFDEGYVNQYDEEPPSEVVINEMTDYLSRIVQRLPDANSLDKKGPNRKI